MNNVTHKGRGVCVLCATYIHIISECPLSPTMQGECDSSYGEEFTYSVLSEELVVGEVYVRVYNEQPTFALEVSDNIHTYV